MPGLRRRRRIWRYLVGLALVFLMIALALWPTASYQGVNQRVLKHRLPLAVKVADFLSRHWHMKALTKQIVNPSMDALERISTIFRWTVENVHKSPKGLPVVDDHVYHIMIRGYGNEDQISDVFTTLCVYAGVPAVSARLSIGDEKPFITVALVLVEGAWRVVDPARNKVFAGPDGSLATVDDLRLHPDEYLSDTSSLVIKGFKYPQYFHSLREPDNPPFIRARLHMPGPRINYEIKQTFGFQSVP